MDNFSTNSPADYLINSLALQSNQTASPIIQTPLQTQVTPTTQPNTPSISVGASFAEEFGSEEIMQQLRDLENQGSLLFRPQLEEIYRKIQCSTLSRHLWSHCQCIDFDKKKDVFKWCQRKLKIEIIHKGSGILMMKSAGSKIATFVCRKQGSTCFVRSQ